MSEPSMILRVNSLRVEYPARRSLLGRYRPPLKAVDDVSFDLPEGQTLALVGESGSGKSTIARALLRVVEPSGGAVWYTPRDGPPIDVVKADGAGLRKARQEIRMVFQDPHSSLNPRMTVFSIITEALRNYRRLSGSARRELAETMIRTVGLGAKDLDRYPHAFSGGQRQRISLLRALAMNPRIILADEPTSALDVSVQAQVLNLMQQVQDEHRLSYVFITHDLHVVRHISDLCAVLYLGRIVESGTTERIFERPMHPYTQSLLASVPADHPRSRGRSVVANTEAPDPALRPAGCAYQSRCRHVQGICGVAAPPVTHAEHDESHTAVCHFTREALDACEVRNAK